MATEALIKAVEQQETLDRLSDQIQPLVLDAFKSAGPVGREVKNVLHGTHLQCSMNPADSRSRGNALRSAQRLPLAIIFRAFGAAPCVAGAQPVASSVPR